MGCLHKALAAFGGGQQLLVSVVGHGANLNFYFALRAPHPAAKHGPTPKHLWASLHRQLQPLRLKRKNLHRQTSQGRQAVGQAFLCFASPGEVRCQTGAKMRGHPCRAREQAPEYKTEVNEGPYGGDTCYSEAGERQQQHLAGFKIHFSAQHQFDWVGLSPQQTGNTQANHIVQMHQTLLGFRCYFQ